MKGLEVAHTFFIDWGLQYLRGEFPQISERAACFLCEGSQSLRNDDELSRDHGWGPHFSIVLTGEDMRRFGSRLRKNINKAAPKEWLGYRFRNPKESITVDSINLWFRKITKFSHPPKTTKAWGRIHHANLYMLRHASIFHDPLGEFSARQQAFSSYPRPIWLRVILGEVYYVWHYGQYNFLDRLAKRNDPVANGICLGAFMQSTMKLCMVLNGELTPYWKWLSAEFRKQPNVSDLVTYLSELAGTQDLDRQVQLVDTICKDLYLRLVEKGLVAENPKGHPHSLMCAQYELEKLTA